MVQVLEEESRLLVKGLADAGGNVLEGFERRL
jgi:hypothetical protein